MTDAMTDDLFVFESFCRNGAEGDARVGVNPRHPIFGGHFPDRPVLPGVCQMRLVRETASRIAGRALAFAVVREVKFLHPVLPERDGVLLVHAELVPDAGGGFAVQAVVTAGEQTKMKIKAVLE